MNVDPSLIVSCSASMACTTTHAIVMSLIMFLALMGGFAYTTWLERRLVSRFQHRVGPNRAGPFGLLQPIADGVKLIFKEDVMPSEADKAVYFISPLLKSVPALVVLAVVPFGPPLLIPWFNGLWYEVPMTITDINVGVLWLLAITSIGTYGVVLAGWSSGNKYSMFGGLRSSAQMISYELSMGLGLLVPVMIVGSMSIMDIIEGQAGPPVLGWFFFQNPLAAVVFMTALLAEVNRSPFDMPEAESELVGGYHTEYSGMKFALFFAAEYVGMIAVSVIAASMYFGGYLWPIPGVSQFPILGPINLIFKVVLFLSGMVWIRATVPRFRYDRLMAFGWKALFPLALLSVIWSAVVLVVSDYTGNALVYGIVSGFVLAVAALFFLIRSWRSSHARVYNPDMTDARDSVGWAALQAAGAVVAAPFAAYDWAQEQRGGFDGFLDATRKENEERQARKAAEQAAASADAAVAETVEEPSADE